MDIRERLEEALGGLEEAAKEKIVGTVESAIEEAVKREVKKEVKRRTRKLVLRAAVIAAAAACGLAAYAYRDKIAAFAAENAKKIPRVILQWPTKPKTE